MLSIVIPTYNEATNIGRLIKEVSKVLEGKHFEIIVADDSSPDGTAKIVDELRGVYPVKLLLRTKDKGLSNAVIDGFKIAKGDVLAVMDADFSHPPKTLLDMIKALDEKTDVIVASRLVDGGGTEDWPRSRRLTSYGASLLAKPITEIKDPMSGFFMIQREVLKGAPIVPRGYKILLEILAKGHYDKAKEVPFIFRDRTAGESKLDWRVNFLYLQHILHLYFYKVKERLKES